MACHCFPVFPDGDEPESPESECVSCDAELDFQLDETCELPGELTVALGEGPDDFLPLADGDQPEYYAGFQGGGHSFFSVQVGNVELSRYDRLEVALDVYYPEECPDDGTHCGPSYGRRVVVLDGEPWTLVEGMVQEHGILMQLEGQTVAQVTVRDPCGRVGWAQHRW